MFSKIFNRQTLINIVLLFFSAAVLSGCKNCFRVSCAECKPFEYEGQVLFQFDSNFYTKEFIKNIQLSVLQLSNGQKAPKYFIRDTVNLTIFGGSLNGYYYNPTYKNKNSKDFIYTFTGTDSTEKWIIDNVNIARTEGKSCCDCGEERIVSLKMNNKTYYSTDLPLFITK